ARGEDPGGGHAEQDRDHRTRAASRSTACCARVPAEGEEWGGPTGSEAALPEEAGSAFRKANEPDLLRGRPVAVNLQVAAERSAGKTPAGSEGRRAPGHSGKARPQGRTP
ncbi:MAG: hypothetical protein M0Z87_01055, partial [Actinomycetota bacterium]|nr:hypothetical protein [Actinomycetota bacterium]